MSDWILNIAPGTVWPSKLTNPSQLTALTAAMEVQSLTSAHNVSFSVMSNIAAGESLKVKSVIVDIWLSSTFPVLEISLTNATKKNQLIYDIQHSVDPPHNSYKYVFISSGPLVTTWTPSEFRIDLSAIPLPVFGMQPYVGGARCSPPNTAVTVGDEHKYCKMYYSENEEIICTQGSGATKYEINNLVVIAPPPPNTCTGYGSGGSNMEWWIWLIIGLVVVVILICIVFWMKKPKMTYQIYRDSGKIYKSPP